MSTIPTASTGETVGHRLRIESTPLGVIKIDASAEAIALQFVRNPPIDPAWISQLIQTRKHYKLSGQDRLRVEEKHPLPAERVSRIREIFRELKQPAAANAPAWP